MKAEYPFSRIQSYLVKAFTLLILFVWQNVNAQVCTSFTVYALDNQGFVYALNTSTAALQTPLNNSGVAPGSSSSNSIGYSAGKSKFYYFSIVNASGGSTFVSYNGASTYVNLTGPFTSGSNNYTVLGTSTSDGNGFYVLDKNGLLWYYKISTDTWTKVVTTKIQDNLGNNLSTQFSTLGSGDIVEDGYGTLWLIPSGGTTYGIYYITSPPTTATATVTATQVLKYNTALPATVTAAGEHWGGAAFDNAGNLFMASLSYLYEMPITIPRTLNFVGAFTGLKAGGTGVFDLAQCTYTSNPLPLSWSSFSVTLSNDKVDLDWDIAQASSVRGFYVERSNDSKNWDTLAFISYINGNLSYSFTDASPVAGDNYYRIAETDYDNESNYSDIRIVNLAASSNISIWPNPVMDVVHVQYSGNLNHMTAVIIDELGRNISKSTIYQGNNTISLSNIPSGIYFMLLEGDNKAVLCKKIIKKGN